jgi:hypothetical protein
MGADGVPHNCMTTKPPVKQAIIEREAMLDFDSI